MSLSHNSKSSNGVAANIWRIVHQVSRKAIFTSLVVVCLLGIFIVYYTDTQVVTSKLANISFRNTTLKERLMGLKYNWISNTTNINVQDENSYHSMKTSMSLNETSSRHLNYQQNVKQTSLKSVFKITTKTLLITQASNSSTTLTPKVRSSTTTLNTSLEHCKESAYIDCLPTNLKPKSDKIIKITFLRRPPWVPKSSLSVAGCRIDQCMVNDDEVANDTDLVVIYGVGLRDSYRVPERWPHQRFAIYILESPFHTQADFITNATSSWNKQINIIMTYRVDSDYFMPYSRLKFNPKPVQRRPNYYEIAKNKTRTAVWIVSHCSTQSKREEYVKQMQKYIDVDILGKCGTPCSKKNSACDDWATKYKFYLSFENALCTDYITEKFFKLFSDDLFVIPVVRGGADYDKHFPNFTYINAAHFKTPKDLALHLKHLASNLEMYSKLLQYKDLYTQVPYSRFSCKVCEHVHTRTFPDTSHIYNLTSWLGLESCHKPTDL